MKTILTRITDYILRNSVCFEYLPVSEDTTVVSIEKGIDDGFNNFIVYLFGFGFCRKDSSVWTMYAAGDFSFVDEC